MPLRSIKNFPLLGTPVPVEITGTTFGNELQNKILKAIYFQNLLMFFLCSLATLRWLIQGN